MRLVKLADKYTGWMGESCLNSPARRFIKRLEHRHNRRHGKKLCRERNDEI